MRKFMMLTLIAFFIAQPSFADNQGTAPDEATSTDCETIAKACLDAGFSRTGGEGKAFWHDCMKPIIFGKQVSGVNIDVKVAKACRQFKIKNLQEQLDELKKYKNK